MQATDTAQARHGSKGHGRALQCSAGVARCGTTLSGKKGLAGEAGRGADGPGVAEHRRQGGAGRGEARHGEARQSKASQARLGGAGRGRDWQDTNRE